MSFFDKNKSIIDLPNEIKLVSRKEFLQKNAEYRLLMQNVPNLLEDAPMEIYKWVEKLVNLIKSV